MRAGRFDRKVIIERNAGKTRNSLNEKVDKWETHKTVWMEKVPIRGKEDLIFEQKRSVEVANFKGYFIEDFTTKDRLNVSGKIWKIHAIQEIGRFEGMIVTAEFVQ